ncbi:MAG: hypothetical protein WDN06_17195 [Asticcacaulis sp.]
MHRYRTHGAPGDAPRHVRPRHGGGSGPELCPRSLCPPDAVDEAVYPEHKLLTTSLYHGRLPALLAGADELARLYPARRSSCAR